RSNIFCCNVLHREHPSYWAPSGVVKSGSLQGTRAERNGAPPVNQRSQHGFTAAPSPAWTEQVARVTSPRRRYLPALEPPPPQTDNKTRTGCTAARAAPASSRRDP